MYGLDILCGISKVPFEIPHLISYPYIERYDFYVTLKFLELLDLRAHMRFVNLPGHHSMYRWSGLDGPLSDHLVLVLHVLCEQV